MAETTTKKRTYKKKAAEQPTIEAESPAVEESVIETAEEAPVVAEKEEVPTATQPTFTEEQVQAMIQQAVSNALANQAPKVIQIAADVEKVHFLWQAEVAPDNRLSIGGINSGYAPIIGKYGEFVIPKSDLSRVMDGQFREWLRRRWLIVVSGLTDEEREIYGVAYKEGEYLDKMAFTRMVELEDKLLDIYPKLCDGHREMVAKRYYEAYMDKNPHVRRDVVTKLNDMSIELGSENGDFDAILAAMNEADRKHKHY